MVVANSTSHEVIKISGKTPQRKIDKIMYVNGSVEQLADQTYLFQLEAQTRASRRSSGAFVPESGYLIESAFGKFECVGVTHYDWPHKIALLGDLIRVNTDEEKALFQKEARFHQALSSKVG